jgi:hypothetical protein
MRSPKPQINREISARQAAEKGCLRSVLNAMNRLLKLTAIIEVATGLALLVVPSVVVQLLLGSPLDTSAAVTLGRVAGAALLALGVGCWLAHCDEQSWAPRGLVAAVLLYNISVAALLSFAGLGLGLHGVALWPAVILHAAMAVWCVACLRRGPQNVMN